MAADLKGAGIIHRMWLSGTIPRSEEQRRLVRLQAFWDGAKKPAVDWDYQSPNASWKTIGVKLKFIRRKARARRFGFSSLQVNTVVMRGINEDELEAFAALTLDRPLRVRFIEFMPAASGGCSRGLTVPGEEILSRLSKRFRLRPAEKEPLAGPARYYRIEGAAGAVGVITPVSCHFCAECNRIRVTAAGMAKGCLFSSHDLDLTPFLRAKDGAGLRRALRSVVSGKPERHPLSPDGSGAGPFPMAAGGG